jgi:hypothetical protein
MGDLITLDANQVSKYDDKAFDATSAGGKYLPRLQLMTSNSEKCKCGEFPINSYALVIGETYHDLGKEVDCLVIAWRPKAIEMGDAVITIHDHTDPEYARIVAKSEEKDSGCMHGPEFLMWVPSKEKFATFFLGSKSGRKEAPAIRALLRQAATLKSKKIETPKYTWYAPQATPCSTPFKMPEMSDVMIEVEKFNNPPKSEVEKAPEAPAEGRAR